jgi:hypothetical protein
MARLPLAFFSAAVLCVLAGMVWGAVMASSENFVLAPAHAHLNLVGWASLGLMGTFYALSGKSGRLGWANFVLSTVGVVVMTPALALMLAGSKAAIPALIVATVLTILGMAAFAISVFSCWAAPKAAGSQAARGEAARAA